MSKFTLEDLGLAQRQVSTYPFDKPAEVMHALGFLHSKLSKVKFHFEPYNKNPSYYYIKVEGLLPVIINNRNYYFPMEWLITWDYPRVPPKVTVVAKEGMVIKPNHPNIISPNIVTVPQLDPKTWSTTGLSVAYDSILSAFQAKSPLVQIGTTTRQLTQTLSSMIYNQLTEYQASAQDAQRKIAEASSSLAEAEQALTQKQNELQSELTQLQTYKETLTKQTESIEKYIAEHPKVTSDVDVLEIAQYPNPVTKQMWELKAKMDAFEDVLSTIGDTRIEPSKLQSNLAELRTLALEDLQNRQDYLELSQSSSSIAPNPPPPIRPF